MISLLKGKRVTGLLEMILGGEATGRCSCTLLYNGAHAGGLGKETVTDSICICNIYSSGQLL